VYVVFAVLLLILMVRCTASDLDKPPPLPAPVKTAEQLKAEQIREADFQNSVQKLRALRASLKDPSSFELVQAARRPDNGTLCVTYRAKNSFNATIVERNAIAKNGVLQDFNAACAGKKFEDISYIRQAL
jgi:hypothetical protein